jgi:Apea-like HEPN
MADYYALTSEPLPQTMFGADSGCAIRQLSEKERLEIEDYFFARGMRVPVSAVSTAVIAPQVRLGTVSIEEFAVLTEFALGVISLAGYQAVSTVAIFSDSKCTEILQRPRLPRGPTPRFPKKLVNAIPSAWVRCIFEVRQKLEGQLHITADRYVRYLRADDSPDGLVDLCICLESLIESQTEVSFRFGVCLSKICGLKDARGSAEILSDLYSLRSKVVHGSDPSREHRKVQPNLLNLRRIARSVLVTYILYLTKHSKKEWQQHLRDSLFS